MDHCMKEPENEMWDNVNGSLNTQFNTAFSGTDSFLSKWRCGVMEDGPLFLSVPLPVSVMHNGWTRATTKCFSPLFVTSIHRVIILGQRVIFLINVCHICGFKENCASQNMGSISAINIQMHGCLLLCLMKNVAWLSMTIYTALCETT